MATQRRFRRYVCMSALSLLFVFACTVGYLAQAHVEVSRYEYQKELSRRLLVAAAVIESLPVNIKLLHNSLDALGRGSQTANDLSFVRNPDYKVLPSVLNANTTYTYNMTPTFALTTKPNAYTAELYSYVFGGTLTLTESEVEASLTFSSRSMTCSIGLCMMVIYLCVYLSFAYGANILVLYRRSVVSGVVVMAVGTLASIAFIAGMVVVVGDAQRELQKYERGRDMTASVVLIGDLVRGMRSAEYRAVTAETLTGAFRALNAGAGGAFVWSVTTPNGVTGPNAVLPAASAFLQEAGSTFRVLEDSPQSLIIAASVYNEAIDATIGYTFKKAMKPTSSTPYLRSGIALGAVGVALLSIALVLCIPISGIGSASPPVVQTEPGAKPLPTEEWAPSSTWDFARAALSSLTLLVAFAVCAVFVISGTSTRQAALPDESLIPNQKAATAVARVMLDMAAASFGGTSLKVKNGVDLLQLPASNRTAISKLFKELNGPTFYLPVNLYKSIDSAPFASLSSNVTNCLADVEDAAVRNEVIKTLSYYDSSFIASINVQNEVRFLETQAALLQEAERLVPACKSVFRFAILNQTQPVWKRLQPFFGLRNRPQRFENAKVLLKSDYGRQTRSLIEAARRAQPDPSSVITGLAPIIQAEEVKCASVIGPAVAAVVMLGCASIVEAVVSFFVYAPSGALNKPNVNRDAFRLLFASLALSIGGIVFLSVAYSQTVAVGEHNPPAPPGVSGSGTTVVNSGYFSILASITHYPADVRTAVAQNLQFRSQHTSLIQRASPAKLAALQTAFGALARFDQDIVAILTVLAISPATTFTDVVQLLDAYRPDKYNATRHNACLTATQRRRYAQLALSVVTWTLAPKLVRAETGLTLKSALAEIAAMSSGLSDACADVAADLNQLKSSEYTQALNALPLARLSGPAALSFGQTDAYLAALQAARNDIVVVSPEDVSESATFWVPVAGAWLLSPLIVATYSAAQTLLAAAFGL